MGPAAWKWPTAANSARFVRPRPRTISSSGRSHYGACPVPVHITKGDFLADPNFHAFAHTCDATGAMASGVSLAFKKRWPAMAADFSRRAAERPFQMGDVVVWTDGTDTVFSLVVQSAPDKPGKTVALDRAVQGMIDAAIAANIDQIAVSRLGAGAADLDWTRIKRVLVDRAEKAPVTLHAFEQFVRAKPAAGG